LTYLTVIIFTNSLKTLYKILMSTWVQSFAPKVYGLALIPINMHVYMYTIFRTQSLLTGVDSY